MTRCEYRRAEDLVNAAPSLDALIKSKQLSFKKKLRSKFTDKRSRSVLSLNHFKDDSMFGMSSVFFFESLSELCIAFVLDKTTCWKRKLWPHFWRVTSWIVLALINSKCSTYERVRLKTSRYIHAEFILPTFSFDYCSYYYSNCCLIGTIGGYSAGPINIWLSRSIWVASWVIKFINLNLSNCFFFSRRNSSSHVTQNMYEYH